MNCRATRKHRYTWHTWRAFDSQSSALTFQCFVCLCFPWIVLIFSIWKFVHIPSKSIVYTKDIYTHQLTSINTFAVRIQWPIWTWIRYCQTNTLKFTSVEGTWISQLKDQTKSSSHMESQTEHHHHIMHTDEFTALQEYIFIHGRFAISIWTSCSPLLAQKYWVKWDGDSRKASWGCCSHQEGYWLRLTVLGLHHLSSYGPLWWPDAGYTITCRDATHRSELSTSNPCYALLQSCRIWIWSGQHQFLVSNGWIEVWVYTWPAYVYSSHISANVCATCVRMWTMSEVWITASPEEKLFNHSAMPTDPNNCLWS